MCGIAVAIDWDNAEEAVRRLTQGILHRGDVSDPIATPRAKTAMGTRRLRIVDPEHGQQPAASFDGQILVSFNGEIYNHKILRAELEAMGIPFRTGSDTEVLANAMRAWGARALSRLSGIFAFVALDLRNSEFLAARDPFGVKAALCDSIRRRFPVLFGNPPAAGGHAGRRCAAGAARSFSHPARLRPHPCHAHRATGTFARDPGQDFGTCSDQPVT